MGLAHYIRRDWRRALAEYSIALKELPNDAELWQRVGYTHRRLGNWHEVARAYQRATELDPRDANLFTDLGCYTQQLTRQYAESMRSCERALNIAPGFAQAAGVRALAHLRGNGSLDALRDVVKGVPDDTPLGGELGSVGTQRAAMLLLERDTDDLLRFAQRLGEDILTSQIVFLPASLYAGWAHQLRNDRVGARAAFERAISRLDGALRDLPNDWRIHAARGLALAGLGRREDAWQEAEWLRTSDVYKGDAYDGPFLAEDRARILAQAGYADGALDEIERLLAGPSWLSVHTLRLDPRWDPIRNHPRFQALLKRHGS